MASTFQCPPDPLAHFRELDAALNAGRRWYESATYLRYAAIAALCCEDGAGDVAKGIRETAEELKKLAGWFGNLRSEIRYVVAAILRMQGDEAAAFYDEVERVRKMFREAEIKRDAAYEMLAILVMRSGLRQCDIRPSHVQRVKELYEEMKMYQRRLTGADDLPALAMLALRDQPVGLMVQSIDQIFEGLRREGLSKSNELQAAACLLFLSEGRAELAVGRAGELIRRFKPRGVTIRKADYNEIAILAFLLNHPDEIVEQVLAYRDEIRQLRPRPDKHMALNIASNIAILDFMRFDEKLVSLNQIKLIVDVQAVIAAQRAQAVVIAAAAAGS